MNRFTARTLVSVHNVANWARRVEAEHPDKVYTVGLFAAGAALAGAVEFAFPGSLEAAITFVGDKAVDVATAAIRESGILPVISPDINPSDPLMQMSGIAS